MSFIQLDGVRRIHQRYPQIPVSTVRYAIINQNDRNDHISKPRSGRPPILSPEQKDHLHKLAIEDPHIKTRELQAAVDSSPSKDTVRHLFHNLHTKKLKQRKQPEMTEENAAKHLAWAHQYAHFAPEDWKRVKWTDECSVERGKGAQTIYTFNSPCHQTIEHDIHAICCRKGVKQMF